MRLIKLHNAIAAMHVLLIAHLYLYERMDLLLDGAYIVTCVCMTQRSIFDVLEIIYILSVITLALSSLNTLYKMCFSIEFESRAQTYNKIHFEDVKALDTIFTLNMAIVLAQ